MKDIQVKRIALLKGEDQRPKDKIHDRAKDVNMGESMVRTSEGGVKFKAYRVNGHSLATVGKGWSSRELDRASIPSNKLLTHPVHTRT